MTPRFAAAAAALAFAASGCAPLLFGGGGPAPQVYRLSSPEAMDGMGSAAGDIEPMGWTVEIARPVASRALATDRIAVSPDGGEVAYAAGARWQSTTPNLVQEYLVARFDADDRILAAVRPGDAVASTCQLRIDLSAFEAVYRQGELAPPQARVRLTAKLIAGADRALAGLRVIDIEEPAAEANLRAIVRAFDQAMMEATEELLTWTLNVGAEDDGLDGQVCDPVRRLRREALQSAGGVEAAAADLRGEP